MMEYAILVEQGKGNGVPFKEIKIAVIFSPFGDGEYVLYPNGNGEVGKVVCKKISDLKKEGRYVIHRSYSSKNGSLVFLKLLKDVLMNMLTKEKELYRENRSLYRLLEDEYEFLESIFGLESAEKNELEENEVEEDKE
jgi:hypothetical protein